MIERHIEVKDYISKSSLPVCDYVINPYIGCTHSCKYCYACFMKRFTGHQEEWGSFIDIKHCSKPLSVKRLTNKNVFLSSVTDCYNPYEEQHQITRGILEQLIKIDCEIGISTKSDLILRDLDLLKQCRNLTVSMSVNTLDEGFQTDMDKASRIGARLAALKRMHEEGIYTILFMSPIFPGLTDFKAIIEETSVYIDEYWFENLNLRGSYKATILDYIKVVYPELLTLYREIYREQNKTYWVYLSKEIDTYCLARNIKYTNFFYHEKLVEEKRNKVKRKLM